MPPQPCVFHRSQVQNSPFHVRTVNLLLDSHVLLNMEAKAIHDSQCIYVYVHMYIYIFPFNILSTRMYHLKASGTAVTHPSTHGFVDISTMLSCYLASENRRREALLVAARG